MRPPKLAKIRRRPRQSVINNTKIPEKKQYILLGYLHAEDQVLQSRICWLFWLKYLPSVPVCRYT